MTTKATLTPAEVIASLTPESKVLLDKMVADAPNWGGLTPLFNHITKETRGNLTQLKRKGLVRTFKSEGEEWAEFTELTATVYGKNFPSM